MLAFLCGPRHTGADRSAFSSGGVVRGHSFADGVVRRAARALAALSSLALLIAASPQVASAQVADVTTTVTLPSSANAGATVNGSVVYLNTGPSTANGLTYTLQLSTGLTGIVFTNLPGGATAVYAANTGTVTLAAMPTSLSPSAIASGNGTSPIGFTYTQPGSATSSATSTIATTSDEGANTAQNSSTATVSGTPIADVTTQLTFPATVDAGQTVSGSALYRNAGPSSASGLAFALTLPIAVDNVVIANLPVGATAAYSNSTGVVTLSGMPASLAASAIASGDGSTPITVSYRQNAVASSTVTSAIGTSTSQATNALPDNASSTVTGALIADVQTVLTFPGAVNAGSTVTGTVLYINNGPSNAAGTTFGLTLTPGLTGVSFSNVPVSVTPSYNVGTGSVSFASAPTSLLSGQIFSGDGTSGIVVNYTQTVTASSSVASTIGTTTSQGANTSADVANAAVGGSLIADVRTVVTAPSAVNAGSPVSASITYANNGPSTASAVGYVLTLSSGLSNVVFGNLPPGASATYASVTGAVTFTGMPATLAAGAIASGNGTSGITVGYTQNGVANSTVTATVSTATNQGADTAADTDSKTVLGGLVADVRTVITAPTAVNAGSAVSVAVTYSNAGPSIASSMGYVLTLTSGLSNVVFGNLPIGAAATYISSSGAVTFTGMPSTLAAGTVASGNGTTGITVVYTQNATASSTVSATVSTSTSQGTNTAADTDSKTVLGGLVADVRSIVTAPTTVNAGSAVSAAVTYTNTGPSTASSMGYVLTLTSGLSNVVFGNLPIGAAATYISGSGAVTFTGMPSTLVAGAIASGNGTSGITVGYTQNSVASSAVTATVSTATDQGANTAADTDSKTVLGGLVADVRTVVTAPTAVNAGSAVSAVVTYSNTGPSTASSMGYVLTLASGLSNVVFGNLPTGAAGTYATGSGAVTFTGMPLTLAAGAIASGNGTSGITVGYTQNGAANSTLTATVSTATDQGANTAADTDSKTVLGSLIADVTTALQGFPTLALPGVTVTGRLVYRNAGPSQSAGMSYGLTLSPGLSGVSLANLPTGASVSYNSTSGLVTFTGMPLTLAATAIASNDGVNGLAVSYTQPVTQQIALASTVATSTNQGANTLADNASASVSGVLGADLVVRKTTTVSDVTPRDTITYTLSAANDGPVVLPAGVVLTDEVPAGLALVSAACATIGGNLCTTAPTASQLVAGATLPGMPIGGTYTLTVRARVTAVDGALVINVARGGLPAGYFDTDSSNNRATAPAVLIRSRPDLAVTKTVDSDTLRAGGFANYIATVINRGTSATTGQITVSDTLPASLRPTGASGTGFVCAITGQIVSCTRSAPITLADTVRVTILTAITPTAPPTAITTVSCARTQDDVNLANDCATLTTPVAGRREVSLRTEALGEFVVGEMGSWRIWARNSGTVPLTGLVSITDTMPRGLTFTSAVGTAWSCGQSAGVITCNLPGPIAVGDSSLLSLSTLVGADAVPTVTNCATVAVQGGAVLLNAGRACATANARADYRLVIELTTPRGERDMQDVPDFTVTVRNTGRSPLPDIVLTNQLPRGFSYVNGTTFRGGAPDALARTRATDPTINASGVSWALGTIPAGGVARLDYRALIGAGADFNSDNITFSSARSSVVGLQVFSNRARLPIRLRRGLFDNRGMIAGKVYVDCSCDRAPGQGRGDLGIPGVRVLMEDGTGAITDVEGKYNFINVRGGLHVVKIDRSTLPAGAQLVALNTRNAGDGYSRFVDLKAGELARADFADGSQSPEVFEQVQGRRRAGEVAAAGDSAQLASLLARPMQTTPGAPVPATQAPVLGGAAVRDTTARSTASAYTPIIAANALHDGNSVLPPTPMRAAAQQTGQPNTANSARVQIDMRATAVPADGRSELPVTVRLFDAAGLPMKGSVPITLEASAGGWRTMDGDALAKGLQVVIQDGVGTFALVTPNLPTMGEVRVTAPMAEATQRVQFTPQDRAFSAIGLLQGRIDLRSLGRGSLDLSATADGFEDQLRDLRAMNDSGRVQAGARGALLLKGNVKGAGLLTLAYDSERDRNRTQFRDISPDEGFNVFGDGSLREFDAQSQQRLYARLDRGASYLRYGDFATPRSDERRLLLAYDRSLTGLSYHGENARGSVNTFASRNRIRQVVDEMAGRGLSGPYFLTRPTAVINSERVEIITRDRNQPSVILKSTPMSRFEEYTVEPLSGRLLFRAPVPSVDANLNPVTIRVSYEVEQGGSEFLTYGGDGRVKLGSRLELGGFAVRDENPLDQQTLLGASAEAALGAGTTMVAEFARTETGTTAVTGDAWRVELRHQSSRLEGRIFAVAGDTAFANRSSTFAGGRNEFGARWSATLNDRTRLIGEALRTEDTRTDGSREGALLSIERRFTQRLVAEVGYRWARQNGATVAPVLGGGLGSTLTGGTGSGIATPFQFSAARARVTATVPGSAKSSVFAEYEFGLDQSRARRGSIGGERVLFDRTRLYLRHEWLSSQQGPYALGTGADQQNTVFGLDANYLRNGQVFSEYRARDAFNGRDAEASMGLRNRWALRPGLLANTSFERVTPLVGVASGTAFAATGAVEWTKAALWKSTARLEYRSSPTGDNLLGSFGYARKLNRDWTMLGRSLWDQMSGSAVRGRSQLGLAWRETDRNRVSALFRLENRLDRSDAVGAPTIRTLSNIAAALLNMQASPRLTLSTRYAAKIASDERESVTARSSAHLLMARSIYDLSPRFDVGLIGSVLGSGGWQQKRYGVGGELGVVVMKNLRLATGYNLFGFTDRDFESLGYTQRGLYLDVGFKFDEALFKKARPTTESTR